MRPLPWHKLLEISQGRNHLPRRWHLEARIGQILCKPKGHRYHLRGSQAWYRNWYKLLNHRNVEFKMQIHLRSQNQKSFNWLICVYFSKDSSLACVSNSTFRLSGSANHGQGDVLWCRRIMTVAGAVVQEIDLEIKDVWFCHQRNSSSTEDWNSLWQPISKNWLGNWFSYSHSCRCRSILESNVFKEKCPESQCLSSLKLANINESTQKKINSQIHNSRFWDPNWSFLQHFRCWSFSVKNKLIFVQQRYEFTTSLTDKKGNEELSAKEKMSHFIF